MFGWTIATFILYATRMRHVPKKGCFNEGLSYPWLQLLNDGQSNSPYTDTSQSHFTANAHLFHPQRDNSLPPHPTNPLFFYSHLILLWLTSSTLRLNRIWSTLAKKREWQDYTPRTGWTFQQRLPKGWGDRGSTVINMLRYKSEGRWFDPSWCHWNFSLTSFRSNYGRLSL